MADRSLFDHIALTVPEFGFEAQNVHKSVDDLIEAQASQQG
jgi:hypothetical protein